MSIYVKILKFITKEIITCIKFIIKEIIVHIPLNYHVINVLQHFQHVSIIHPELTKCICHSLNC